MRKLLISILLASAVATPALADPPKDRDQTREERKQAREERQQARQDSRSERVQPQQRVQPQMQVPQQSIAPAAPPPRAAPAPKCRSLSNRWPPPLACRRSGLQTCRLLGPMHAATCASI